MPMINTTPQDSVEEWRDIPGWTGIYQVSDRGKVRRGDRNKRSSPDGIVKPKIHRRGYRAVCLRESPRIEYWLIHRLVMLAFVGEAPSGTEVNHKNGQKDDNRLANLEYVTSSGNKLHRAYVLGKGIGEDNAHSSLTEENVRQIRDRYAAGEQGIDLANEFGVQKSEISRVVNRTRWKHVK